MASKSSSPALALGPSTLDVAFDAGTLGLQLKRLRSSDPLATGTALIPCYAFINDVVKGSQGDKGGVKVGDGVIAISGVEFSRKAPALTFSAPSPTKTPGGLTTIVSEGNLADSNSSSEGSDFVHVPNAGVNTGTNTSNSQELGHVDESSYEDLMVAIKSHDRKESPLVITFQRYHWSSDELAWSRFLTARDFDLDSSKAMIKQQQLWRKENLPVDRLDPGIVRVLNSGGVGSVLHPPALITSPDNDDTSTPNPFLYVNLASIQSLNAEMLAEGNENGSDLIVKAFVSLTEECLDASPNPSAPKVSQLIDLGSIGLNFSPSILKQVYQVFESNYPETLNHFIIYPVNRFVAAGIYGVLSFINEKTRKKFIVTDRIEVVCEHLGLREDEVGPDLGEFMRTKSGGEEECK